MRLSILLTPIVAVTLLSVVACTAEDASKVDNKQSGFATPDDAFQALVQGMENNSDEQLLDVLGRAHKDLVVQSDKEASSQTRTKLSKLAKENLKIVIDGDKATACLGLKCWPYPIPLVKSADGWRFDTAAGKEEILNRRIGRNELSALKFVDAYDDAQRVYASMDHTGDKVLKYAQKLISTKGMKDGLYWPIPSDAKESASPLAAIVDDQQEFVSGADVPYNGYYFKILTKQGANAPNGKHDYIINGNMIAGFALVAWPADYDSSGVMTFVINQQGIVYEKNLGVDTAKLASEMVEYNPDETWKAVKPEQK